MISTQERKVFSQGMDIMMEVKRSIMNLRDIIAKGKEVSQSLPEDNDDIQEFYRTEIEKAHQDISAKKAVAKDFIDRHEKEYPAAMAIFQKEYDSLPA